MTTESLSPGGATSSMAASGIHGLDDVMGGGFVPRRLYLIEGAPGTGKTTLSLQFLMEGVRRGESVLHVTLSETEQEVRSVAHSHGWSIEGVHIRELSPSEDLLKIDEQYTMFHPSEVELGETIKALLEDVDERKPTRVVIDSMSELRLLAGSQLKFRRQLLALKRFFSLRDCTVLVLDDLVVPDQDAQIASIAHAVIRLERLQSDYGADRRRLSVSKYRGVKFRDGYHDYVIAHGGLVVFPRLVALEHQAQRMLEKIGTGIPAIDSLLGGGLERGTSTLVVGAAGTGKSTLAAQCAVAAVERGESAALFIFDESVNTLLSRTDGLGINLREHVHRGRIKIKQVDPAELSPGEFVHSIRQAVQEDHASIVVIDSLNGYLNAMPGERYLIIQLHELLTYLGHRGVATVLIGAHHGMIGSQMHSPVDASYLADAIIMIRYFEARGEVRQAISVVKKRGGAHERTIREFQLDASGIHVGPPLRQYRGILTGVPQESAVEGEPKS